MPRATRAPERRSEIAQRAAALFDVAGFNRTSMDAVAQRAGLQKPSLYHYFASKHELLFAIHDEFIEILIAREAERERCESNAAVALRGVIRDILELMDTHRGHVRVFFEHHRELSPEHRAIIATKRDRYMAATEAHIARGIASGEFRDVDARLVTLALFGMCNWAYQWYQPGGARSSREIADFFFDLFLNGLRRKDA